MRAQVGMLLGLAMIVAAAFVGLGEVGGSVVLALCGLAVTVACAMRAVADGRS